MDGGLDGGEEPGKGLRAKQPIVCRCHAHAISERQEYVERLPPFTNGEADKDLSSATR